MVSDRIDGVPHNCFHVSSRINSTWGGNLVDMVRSKNIMEIIRDENLVKNSKERGKYLLERLQILQVHFPVLVGNARGLGLMCSFDLQDKEHQKSFINNCFENKLMILGCGERTIRFRPPLNITDEELEEGLQVVEKVLKLM
jgi:L-lysine 6-transaminase